MSSSSPLPTEEELLLVKEYAVLPVMLDILEGDSKLIGRSELKLSRLYSKQLKHIQGAVFERQLVVKKQLQRQHIRIITLKRTDVSLQVQYQCRGYQHSMELRWEIVYADIQLRLGHHLQLTME